MDSRINRAVGKALRKTRELRGLTQGEVARHLGENQAFVSKLEQGERSMMYLDLYAYAHALGISSEELSAALVRAIAYLAKDETNKGGGSA